jgi:molybdopterin-guanine dinucleotide biosynthesis protein A
MNAIVTAGGKTRPDEPLYPVSGEGYKALLDVNGRPMVQYVLDALNGSQQIEKIILVGLPRDNLLESSRPLLRLEDQGDMIANILAAGRALAELDPAATHCLLVSSDIPAITTEMVDWLIEQVGQSDHEIYYNVIDRKVMEARYPGSRRTFVHLKGIEVCGGDMGAIRLSLTSNENPLWDKVVDARKSPLRQAALIGYDTLFLLLLRRLSIQDAELAVSRKLGVRGRVITCPYAEMGMDVDKPFQLEIVREDLARRNG